MEDLKLIYHVSVLDIIQVFEVCLFSRGVIGLKLSSGKINITLRLPLDHLARE